MYDWDIELSPYELLLTKSFVPFNYETEQIFNWNCGNKLKLSEWILSIIFYVFMLSAKIIRRVSLRFHVTFWSGHKKPKVITNFQIVNIFPAPRFWDIQWNRSWQRGTLSCLFLSSILKAFMKRKGFSQMKWN